MKVGKTNKSFSHRLRVTKNGKILAMAAGHAKYNAKASRKSQLHRKRGSQVVIKMRIMSKSMPQMANRLTQPDANLISHS